jgi:hypothetical protein
MSKAVFALAMFLALSGCVVVWGRAYEVEAETSEWITIKYDTTFTSLADVQQVAQARCDTHRKRAVFRDQSLNIWHLTTANFDCVAK